MPDSGLADGDVLTSAFYDDYIREQVVVTCTSLTRPTGVEGRMIYETDTNYVLCYNGSSWVVVGLEKQTYTPTLGGIAEGTGGSAANTAGYSFSFGNLLAYGTIQFGTSGATYPSASNTITLPTAFTPTVSSSPNFPVVGTVTLQAGGVGAYGPVVLVSSTQLRLYVYGTGGTYANATTLSTTVPGTWAAGDYIRWQASLVGSMA